MTNGFRWAGGFMEHYVRLATQVMIPYQEEVLRDPALSGAADNFIKASECLRGERSPAKGDFTGMVFQDSDVYKWIEAAAYSLAYMPDEALRCRVAAMVSLVASAQEEDGYIDTYFTLGNDDKKFTNLMEAHELYCAGHLIEAAVALCESAGDGSLLEVAERNAALLCREFLAQGREGYPGHPEIELALMRLWKATGKDIYRDLARHFIDVRGIDRDFFVKEEAERDWSVWGMDTSDKMYAQYHLPLREQRDAVGHSVRAMYLYTAMALLAKADGDTSLSDACFALFDSVSKRRMYITGGIGSTARGEAFTADYDLPGDTAYAETCASVGLVFFCSALLKLKKEGRFADVMERALYNTVLSGIGADGRSFFYVNPLEAAIGITARTPESEHVNITRQGWFGCACCPPNAARLLASVSSYAWEEDSGVVYSHLFVSGRIETQCLTVSTETRYPFGDTVSYTVEKGCGRLAVRLPSFSSEDFSFSKQYELRDGYIYCEVNEGDEILLKLNMEPVLNHADPRVSYASGRAAVSIGPVVYCAEDADNEDVSRLCLGRGKMKRTETDPCDLGLPPAARGMGRIYTVEAEAVRILPGEPDKLYFTRIKEEPCRVKLIPYFLWANRTPGSMKVWLPLR